MRSCSGNQSNGKPGADVEIASTVTPPPPPPPSLILSSLTQLHAQTSPLYPSAGLCCQPLFFTFNICCSNQFKPSCSSCALTRYDLPVDCLAGVNMYISKYLYSTKQQGCKFHCKHTQIKMTTKQKDVCVCI